MISPCLGYSPINRKFTDMDILADDTKHIRHAVGMLGMGHKNRNRAIEIENMNHDNIPFENIMLPSLVHDIIIEELKRITKNHFYA